MSVQRVEITRPSSEQIEAWWIWAANLSDAEGPFRKDIGYKFDEVRQPSDRFFCLSCTAGIGGVDNTRRPLKGAMQKQVPVLVPAFIACGYVSLDKAVDRSNLVIDARKEVGTIDSNGEPSAPAVVLNVNDEPRSGYYIEQDVEAVDFAHDNSFGIQQGRYYLVTAGYWALIVDPFRKIIFGGKGGRVSKTKPEPFETRVTYEIP